MTIRLAGEGDAAGILAIYGPIVRETAISFELQARPEWREALASGLAELRAT